MRTKPKVVQAFSKLDPADRKYTNVTPEQQELEQEKYKREKVLLEVMLDIRELLKE